MKQIVIQTGYDTSVSFTPSQLVGITGTGVLLIISLVILIKSFEFDKK